MVKSKLGATTIYKYGPVDTSLLDRFENPMKSGPGKGMIMIKSPEFTSLCPVTGQPDFATIFVKYQPLDWCLESKSWKLYLGTFRQAREYHETCIHKITTDLIELLDPLYLRVKGEFTPRGGIPFWPLITYTRAQTNGAK